MFDDPDLGRAVSAMRELILAGERYRLAVATYLGLSGTESQAVSYLLVRGALGQSELGHALGFNSSSVTALVDRLEKNGMVYRRADPRDRRRSSVALTDSARTTLSVANDWLAEIFGDYEADQLTACVATMDRLATRLRTVAGSVPGRAPQTTARTPSSTDSAGAGSDGQ